MFSMGLFRMGPNTAESTEDLEFTRMSRNIWNGYWIVLGRLEINLRLTSADK